ncbi:hypothetical protein BBP40_003534 [Aspergillus hancockii]|nr:hypothetical protein BBP40_003534 [Aspergillus hancockii]
MAIAPPPEASRYSLADPEILTLNQRVTQASDPQIPPSRSWSIPAGVYTPRQLVRSFAPLLETVLHHLGPDSPNTTPVRTALLDNIAANLATDTRESSLPLPEEILDISRREIRDQARRIGRALVQWAREYTGGPYDPELSFRSPCEGHLLLQQNANLMFGRRSQPHLMQLLNEYMHQMIILRDALLPFQNFDAVQIPIDGKARGIRHLEGPRARFITGVLTRRVTQASIITLARAVLAPDLPITQTGGYGFQYAHGIILPALLAGGAIPYHLLRYMPSKIDPATSEILFDYQFTDYYDAPRVEISAGRMTHSTAYPTDWQVKSAKVQTAGVQLLPATSPSSVRGLELRLQFANGESTGVDVGQIAKGLRYSYEAETEMPARFYNQNIILHSASDILVQPDLGLITAQNGGLHVIPVEDPTVALALLGKLYPENVVLLPIDEELEQAERSGKGYEPKFVIWGGFKRGGLKGIF